MPSNKNKKKTKPSLNQLLYVDQINPKYFTHCYLAKCDCVRGARFYIIFV